MPHPHADPAPVHDDGGAGRPILLLHGLMGSAATWRRQVPWLRGHGHVYSVDAAGHGRAALASPTTEAFVDDLVWQLDHAHAAPDGPAVVIGHSMGGLHAWMLAARHPERVSALVVEDMAPDFRGRTADDWAAMIAAWPQPFPTEDDALAFFGPVAGRYFLDSFRRDEHGWWLHGDVRTFREISDEWGRRDFWAQWEAVDVPTLVIEGEHTITPPGQMRRMAQRPDTRYVRIAGAGHLVHDDRPDEYRRAVEDFLRSLPDPL